MAKTYPFFISPTRRIFRFTSVGTKGEIIKIVQFKYLSDDNSRDAYWNVALGDVKVDGNGDSYIEFYDPTNNGDISSVINTVAEIIFVFSAEHPEDLIFVKGYDGKRNTVYQRELSRRLSSLESQFDFLGRKSPTSSWEPFKEGENYDGFLVVRLD